MKKKLSITLAVVLVVATLITVLVGCTGVSDLYVEPAAAVEMSTVTQIAALDGSTLIDSNNFNRILVKKGSVGSEKFAIYNVATQAFVKDFTDYSEMRFAEYTDFAGFGSNANFPQFIVATDRAAEPTKYLLDNNGVELAKVTGASTFNMSFLRLTNDKFLVKDSSSSFAKYFIAQNAEKTTDIDSTSLSFDSSVFGYTIVGESTDGYVFKKNQNYIAFNHSFEFQGMVNLAKTLYENENGITGPFMLSNGKVLISMSKQLPADATSYTFTDDAGNKISYRTMELDVFASSIKEVKTKYVFEDINNICTDSDFYKRYNSSVANVAEYYVIEDKSLSLYQYTSVMSDSLKMGLDFDDIIEGFVYYGTSMVASDRVIVRGSASAALCDFKGKKIADVSLSAATAGIESSYGKFFVVGNNAYSSDTGEFICNFGEYSVEYVAGDTVIASKDGKAYTATINAPTVMTEITNFGTITGMYYSKNGETYSYYSVLTGQKVFESTVMLGNATIAFSDGVPVAIVYAGSDGNFYRFA